MTEVKYNTTAKILKYLSYIVMGAAVVLIMLGFSGLWMGSTIPGLDPLWLLVFGFLLFATSIPLLIMAQAGIIKPEFDSVSLLKCQNPECKYTKGRKFEKDEYVFKELDETCEKCNSKLYIAAIFEVERTPKQEKKDEEPESPKEIGDTKEEDNAPVPEPGKQPPVTTP